MTETSGFPTPLPSVRLDTYQHRDDATVFGTRFGESMAPMILHRLHHGALQQSDLKAKAALRDHQQAILAAHAAAMAIELPGGDHKDGVISSVTSRWAGYDSEGAGWLKHCPTGSREIRHCRALSRASPPSNRKPPPRMLPHCHPGSVRESRHGDETLGVNRTDPSAMAAQFPEGHAIECNANLDDHLGTK